MHAAEDDDLGAGPGRLLREAERVAHLIRQILDFRHLVIVREDDGVELLLERKNVARERIKLRGRERLPHVEFGVAAGTSTRASGGA